jgi:Protein of unknown function (DUF1579)
MGKFIAVTLLATLGSVAAPLVGAQERNDAQRSSAAKQEQMPLWMSRGLPGPQHRALDSLIGTWKVELSMYGTIGRDPNDPPIVSKDLICRREWVAGGRYIEDTTQGTLGDGKYWRKGWLGYSNMDRRHEWITIDAVNSNMMYYAGRPGSTSASPIIMTGVFTDQGVAGEASVGKSVDMRTVIKIENPDRHVMELYFTPPGKKEILAQRAIYTRAKADQ